MCKRGLDAAGCTAAGIPMTGSSASIRGISVSMASASDSIASASESVAYPPGVYNLSSVPWNVPVQKQKCTCIKHFAQ